MSEEKTRMIAVQLSPDEAWAVPAIAQMAAAVDACKEGCCRGEFIPKIVEHMRLWTVRMKEKTGEEPSVPAKVAYMTGSWDAARDVRLAFVELLDEAGMKDQFFTYLARRSEGEHLS